MVRAVYHQGQLRLLDPVNLKEGQQVHLQMKLRTRKLMRTRFFRNLTSS